ncbi:SH3 domain-containing protein [Tabrizicola sp. M-4]|uniref:SH3 domain-containing protein n=1 Tax=Tabrizicola sp. M-4 TaxID=3055847 RepID=UPI003DA9782E
MFRYLLFFSIGLYLTLLIGGEDRGQLRAGLRGEYAIDLTPPALPPVTTAEAEEPPAATLASTAPTDTIRILPAPERPEPASLTLAPSEPALALLEDPALPMGTITAQAANVRAGAGGSAAIIGRVERGEIVQIVEQVGDWMHVRIEGDGVEGFVHRSLIAEAGPSLGNATLFPAID